MLHIAILNLMPNKKETEGHLLGLLEKADIPFEVCFLYLETHKTKSVEFNYIKENYSTFSQIKHRKFDGLIVTGAPVELIDFEEVDFWNELKEIFDWATINVISTFFICWASMAALYHYYGIPKYTLKEKMFGVFDHINHFPSFPLMKDFGEIIKIPHSRHTEVTIEDITKVNDLITLASSNESGVSLVSNKTGSRIFAPGHSEYPQERLKFEYERDLLKGLPINMPKHYFPHNDVSKLPEFSWKEDAKILFKSWMEFLKK